MTSRRAWAKNRARQINRLRWVRKYRNVARSEGNASGLEALAYILADPELDTYSYELANDAELAESLAPIADRSPEAITALFDEARQDPVLAARIRRGTRWDLAVKRQPPIGRHLVTYALVRAIDPPVVLEIGVRFGLGSLVILRALERNRSEGSAGGELISVDIDPYAGSMVDRSTPGWSFVAGPSPEVLQDAVSAEHRIGLVICDSVPQPWVTTAEIRTALEHAAAPLVLMQSGWNLVVPDLCDAADVPWVRIVEQPTSHIGAGRQAFVARLSNQHEVDATLRAADRWPRGRREAD